MGKEKLFPIATDSLLKIPPEAMTAIGDFLKTDKKGKVAIFQAERKTFLFFIRFPENLPSSENNFWVFKFRLTDLLDPENPSEEVQKRCEKIFPGKKIYSPEIFED